MERLVARGAELDLGLGVERVLDRPSPPLASEDHARRGSGARLTETRGRGELEAFAAARTHAVDQGEGKVGQAGGELGRHRGARFVHSLEIRGPLGEAPEELEASRAEDLARRLGARDEDPSDPSGLVPDGAVRVVEVALLGEPVALEDEEAVPHGRGAAGEDPLDHRLDDGPDLPPASAPLLPHGFRVLRLAEDGAVRVVVELDELAAPPDEHRVLRGEEDGDGRA